MGLIAVVVGGGPVSSLVTEMNEVDEIVAADSGLDRAREAGLSPDVLVGDLDSVSDDGLRWAEAHGVRVERHRPDKDDTDTALALRYALGTAHRDLLVLGSATMDRLDHQLGTISALGAPELAAFDSITARLGESVVHVLHTGHDLRLDLASGDVFSLLALHGECHGVDVTGARWPLHDADLLPGTTLGISNEALGGIVHVAVASGVVTLVRPAPLTSEMAA